VLSLAAKRARKASHRKKLCSMCSGDEGVFMLGCSLVGKIMYACVPCSSTVKLPPVWCTIGWWWVVERCSVHSSQCGCGAPCAVRGALALPCRCLSWRVGHLDCFYRRSKYSPPVAVRAIAHLCLTELVVAVPNSCMLGLVGVWYGVPHTPTPPLLQASEGV
jgi:hypothetical protein